jgi:hypothetical protein
LLEQNFIQVDYKTKTKMPFLPNFLKYKTTYTKKKEIVRFPFFISKTERRYRHRHLCYFQKLRLQKVSFWSEMDYHPDPHSW